METTGCINPYTMKTAYALFDYTWMLPGSSFRSSLRRVRSSGAWYLSFGVFQGFRFKV